ncbi:pesticin C-terminus-like muramidase [Photobacterium nomapromontoriensis]|uniref:pesticin C-terminus-like muramidase n=1 Tax=Photobacterium nomapromontoriensis TaxID=2910237 RepID=UPI003D142F1C
MTTILTQGGTSAYWSSPTSGGFGNSYNEAVANYNKQQAQLNSSTPTTPSSLQTQSHTVVKGDSLSQIAQNNGLTLSEIVQINPQYKGREHLINVGDQVILKPVQGSSEVQTRKKALTPCSNCGKTKSCTVKIDYDFISSLEGGMMLKGYAPDPEANQSGVTISVGFDLGARNIHDLETLSLNKKLVDKLTPYLGRKKQAAVNFLKENPLIISKEEAEKIYTTTKKLATSQLIDRYGSKSSIKFKCLPKQAQTVIASVAYQYGNLERRTKGFWKQSITQNWADMYENLMDFQDVYPTRRYKEAKLIKELL